MAAIMGQIVAEIQTGKGPVEQFMGWDASVGQQFSLFVQRIPKSMWAQRHELFVCFVCVLRCLASCTSALTEALLLRFLFSLSHTCSLAREKTLLWCTASDLNPSRVELLNERFCISKAIQVESGGHIVVSKCRSVLLCYTTLYILVLFDMCSCAFTFVIEFECRS